MNNKKRLPLILSVDIILPFDIKFLLIVLYLLDSFHLHDWSKLKNMDQFSLVNSSFIDLFQSLAR